MNEPQQLVFELPKLDACDREDFLVSQCNQSAVDIIDRWPDWPGHAVVISGAGGSGKTHLVSVWRRRSGGQTMSMADLTPRTVEQFASNPHLAIEDVRAGLGAEAERLVFHLLNQAREFKGHVLITTQQAPGDLAIQLPDLRSRLRALALAEIKPIDDALLAGLLIKLFSDRQLAVDPGVVKYLTQRIERSAASARAVVERIDRLALTSHRKVTRALAADALR